MEDENSIIMNDVFTNLAQWAIPGTRKLHSFPSQTVKLESVIIQLLTLPGRRELL
jgi:hypothetical protein